MRVDARRSRQGVDEETKPRVGAMPAQLEDPDEHDNKPVRALDEDDIALLKTYVRHPRLPQAWPMTPCYCATPASGAGYADACRF
jgi:hypothetical protein